MRSETIYDLGFQGIDSAPLQVQGTGVQETERKRKRCATSHHRSDGKYLGGGKSKSRVCCMYGTIDGKVDNGRPA